MIMTVDLALGNVGLVIWNKDIPIHWEAFKTEKTSKKKLKQVKQDVRLIKKLLKQPKRINLSYYDILYNRYPDIHIDKNEMLNIKYPDTKIIKIQLNEIDLKDLYENYYMKMLAYKSVEFDRIRRINMLASKLVKLIAKYKIKHVIAELPSGSQSATADRLMGMSIATLATCTTVLNVPINYVTPQRVKLTICNKLSATKFEIMKKVKELYPNCDFPKQQYKFEHIADAIAVKLVDEKYYLTNNI